MKNRLTIPKEFIRDDVGSHNGQLDQSIGRLVRGRTYRDLSTIWITPTRGNIIPRVVASWMALMRPMNQPFLGPIFMDQDEVGVAYQKAFDMILQHPELSKWKYVLTVEQDNLPAQDGLIKLYESIEQGYDCVSGLYWTKGETGQPMIYGNPMVMPKNFVPQLPVPDSLQYCNGLGMGFNLWRVDSFRTKLRDMPKPWFQTIQEIGKKYTQDLWFYQEASKYGWKCACNTSVRVGHIDDTGYVW